MSRISTIDVTYCAVKNKEMAMSVDSGGALVDFSGDSKIVPQGLLKIIYFCLSFYVYVIISQFMGSLAL